MVPVKNWQVTSHISATSLSLEITLWKMLIQAFSGPDELQLDHYIRYQ